MSSNSQTREQTNQFKMLLIYFLKIFSIHTIGFSFILLKIKYENNEIIFRKKLDYKFIDWQSFCFLYLVVLQSYAGAKKLGIQFVKTLLKMHETQKYR